MAGARVVKTNIQPLDSSPTRALMLVFSDNRYVSLPVADATVLTVDGESFSLSDCTNVFLVASDDPVLEALV
jgi:hypothetical protein